MSIRSDLLSSQNMNHGQDIGGNPVNPPTSIFIGVGANPVRRSDRAEQTKVWMPGGLVITQPVSMLTHFSAFLIEFKGSDRLYSCGCGLLQV